MSRSLKKGPFVEPRLLDRIEKMNAAGEKNVIKTWSRASTIFPKWWATPSRCTTVASTCRFTLPSPWSVTSWASSPTRTFKGHAADKKKR